MDYSLPVWRFGKRDLQDLADTDPERVEVIEDAGQGGLVGQVAVKNGLRGLRIDGQRGKPGRVRSRRPAQYADDVTAHRSAPFTARLDSADTTATW